MSILNHGIALIIRSYGLLFVHAPILDICFSLARCPRYILDSDIACDTLVGVSSVVDDDDDDDDDIKY
jgi:hypothetical protein